MNSSPIAANLALDGAPVTVYKKPGCAPCNATTRALDKAGLDYHLIDMTTAPNSEQLLEQFKQLGAAAAPVVVAPGGTWWSGFRPDLVRTLAASIPDPNPELAPLSPTPPGVGLT